MNNKSLPWIKEYKIAGIAETLKPYPDKPVYDILYVSAKRYKKMGLIQYNTLMTYPEVKDKVDPFRHSTFQIGFAKGRSGRYHFTHLNSICYIRLCHFQSRAGTNSLQFIEPIWPLNINSSRVPPGQLITLDEQVDLAVQVMQKCRIEYLILCRLSDFTKSSSFKQNGSIPKKAIWMIQRRRFPIVTAGYIL